VVVAVIAAAHVDVAERQALLLLLLRTSSNASGWKFSFSAFWRLSAGSVTLPGCGQALLLL